MTCSAHVHGSWMQPNTYAVCALRALHGRHPRWVILPASGERSMDGDGSRKKREDWQGGLVGGDGRRREGRRGCTGLELGLEVRLLVGNAGALMGPMGQWQRGGKASLPVSHHPCLPPSLTPFLPLCISPSYSPPRTPLSRPWADGPELPARGTAGQQGVGCTTMGRAP